MIGPPYFCNAADCAPCRALKPTHPEPPPPLGPCSACDRLASHTMKGVARCDGCAGTVSGLERSELEELCRNL